MAILTAGGTTYGNKTYSDILSLTGMSLGNTVYDTTNSVKRIYDGDNWCHGNQKSMTTKGGILDGAWMVVDNAVDNTIDFQRTANDEGIIGIAEDAVTGSVDDVVPLTYAGNVAICLIVASAGADNAEAGDSVFADAISSGYGDADVVYSSGTCGTYLDATATTTGERRIIFKGVERF